MSIIRDYYGFKIWFVCTVMVVVIFIIGALMAAGFARLDERSCERSGQQLHREVTYDFWGAGCYVESDDGTFVPLDNLIITNEESS